MGDITLLLYIIIPISARVQHTCMYISAQAGHRLERLLTREYRDDVRPSCPPSETNYADSREHERRIDRMPNYGRSLTPGTLPDPPGSRSFQLSSGKHCFFARSKTPHSHSNFLEDQVYHQNIPLKTKYQLAKLRYYPNDTKSVFSIVIIYKN